MSKESRLDRLKTSQIFSLDFRRYVLLKKVFGRVADEAEYDDNLLSANICRNLTLALPGTMGSHLYSKVYTHNIVTISKYENSNKYVNNEKLIL